LTAAEDAVANEAPPREGDGRTPRRPAGDDSRQSWYGNAAVRRPTLEPLEVELSSDFARFIAMPRYFFSTYHDVSHIDHDGEEFADKHAAWQEATRMAGDIN
jgi:hypothetical protein